MTRRRLGDKLAFVKGAVVWALAAGLVSTASVVACGARSGLYAASTSGGNGGDETQQHTEDCLEAGQNYIYVITEESTLSSFDPSTGVLAPIAKVACPTTDGATPFSMGVNRTGTAYVVFDDGHLFRVNTGTAECEATDFKVDQHGFEKFGMGFATDQGGPSERLYVSESSYKTPSKGLATIDTTTLELTPVAHFSKDLGDAVELTGTGDGRLFGFFLAGAEPGSHLAEIDKSTGEILSDTHLPIGNMDTAFAFAFFGGDFYLFTADAGQPTVLTRYRPADGSLVQIAKLTNNVVGVGVSTCAPAR